MKVYFVGAGPGDPDLLTVKARRLLENCNVCIYAGSLVSPAVLDILPGHAEKHNSAGLDLQEIIDIIIEAKRNATNVVRLHTGDPSIYGAIGEQIRELIKLDIQYEVIPGVSSFQASAASLKTELTAPEISQTIILTRISGRTPVPEKQELEALAASRSTLCVFLSAHKATSVAEKLVKFYGENCPAAVVFKASWPDEKIIRGTLKDIGSKTEAEGINKTAMIIVGEAINIPEFSSKLYDRKFSHEYRAGKKK